MASADPELSRFRTLSGRWGVFTSLLLAALPVIGAVFVLDIPSYLKLPVLREQYLGIFLALVLGGVFLVVPVTRRRARDHVPWYDMVLAVLGFSVGLYVALFYPSILWKMGMVDTPRVVMSTLAILLVLEAVRRMTGWILVAIGVVFILYARFSWLAPGTLSGLGVPWPRLSNYLFLDTNSVLGLPLGVAALIVLPFVLFGNLLSESGGGRCITDLALSVMGRFRGGPAKMAVVAGSLFGTVSGSAVANVAVDGWINIPMMKNTGWKAHMASAVEAVASTGGQLMPPIMGAAAFLIAEFLGMSYREVILAALVPAVLYYVTLFTQVDLEAARSGLRGLPRTELPTLGGVLRRHGLFFIPLVVLVYAIFGLHLEVGKAALLAAATVVAVGMVHHHRRFRIGWLLKGLVDTGKGVLDIGVIVTLAGFVIGVLSVTGMGFRLSMVLTDLAGGNVIVLLAIVAVANIVLGMGMPTTAVYILLAVLTAPALVQMGIEPLAAHLFIFYFGMLSMITPPICMATYVAASIGRANIWRAGLAGMRLGAVAYVVPFLFVLSPALLLLGTRNEIILVVVTAVSGTVLLGIALAGYLFQELNWTKRVLFGLAALGLLTPAAGRFALFGLAGDVVGVGIALTLGAWELRGIRRRRAEAWQVASVPSTSASA